MKNDPEFERVLALMTAGRLDRAARDRQQQYQEILERMAARGLATSGPRYSAQWAASIDLFREAVLGLAADFVQASADFGLNADELIELLGRYRETVTQSAEGLIRHALDFTRNEPQLLRGCEEQVRRAEAEALRDAEILFRREAARRRSRVTATSERSDSAPRETRDVFISHAGRDRASFVDALAHELEIRGVTAWYSEAEITLGDSLRGRIDDGLCSSRFGVVVLSPHFFESPWSKAELDALASRAATEGRKVVLPVLHELTHEQLSRLSPTLGRVTHTSSREGVSAVVDKIVRAIKAANRAE